MRRARPPGGPRRPTQGRRHLCAHVPRGHQLRERERENASLPDAGERIKGPELPTWDDGRIPVFTFVFLLVSDVLCPPVPVGGQSLRGKAEWKRVSTGLVYNSLRREMLPKE